MNIHCKTLQTGRLAQDNLHGAHCLLAGLNIICSGAILSTLSVICFDLLDLFLIQQHLCDTRMVLDGYCQTICNCLVHGVTVDFITEGLVRFGNGCATESNKGCLRECFLQNLRIRLGHHCPHVFISILAELNLLCVLKLGSVCFVGKANDIGSTVDQTNLIIFSVAKLLNGTDIESTALPGTQFLPQCSAAGNNSHFTQIQELLAFGKQLRTLLL